MSNQEQPSKGPSPGALVDRLFQHFACMYGSLWLDRWAGIPLPEVKATWARDLSRVSPGQMARALDHLKAHNPMPPTLPEFLSLCRQFRVADPVLALPPPRGEIPEAAREILARLKLPKVA